MEIRMFHGQKIAPYIKNLAALRMCVFRAFPYLYEGSESYEEAYLETYAKTPESLFVLVFDGDAVVGASTGIPMRDEVDDIKAPFINNGYDIEKIFYFGESVLLPTYRGRGLGVRFFEEREAYAKQLGRFDWCCFCAVQRPADHPMRPLSFTPLNAFWQKRGFIHHAELKTCLSWPDIGQEYDSRKTMSFWLKSCS